MNGHTLNGQNIPQVDDAKYLRLHQSQAKLEKKYIY